MSMLRALAMLGSGMEGFVKGQRDEEAAQRLRDDDTYQKTQRTFQQGQQQRALDEQAEMAAAAARRDSPQLVSSMTEATRASSAAPTVAVDQLAPTATAAEGAENYRLGDASGAPAQQDLPLKQRPDQQGVAPGPMQATLAATQPASAPQAKSATPVRVMQNAVSAADPNSPEAVLERQIAVKAKYDPEGAARMRLTAMKVRLDGMDLADKQWDSDVEDARAKGLNGLLAFTDATHADGQGGAVKSRAVFSPDKKTFTIVRVMPDGSTQPTNMPAMPNDQSGVDTLAMALKKGVPIQARLAHYAQVKKEDREGRVADADVELKKAQAGYFTARPDLMQQAIDAKGSKMPEEDKLQVQDLNKQLELINSERVKAMAMGMWQADSPGAKAILKQESALQMQRDALLAKYGGDKTVKPDPLGLRDKDAGGISITRPATMREAIERDMHKNPPQGDVAINVANPNAPINRYEREGEIPAAAPTPKAVAGLTSAAVGPMQKVLQRQATSRPPTALPTVGEPDGAALDAARAASSVAYRKLQNFGSAQRARDPQGFAAAQQAYNSAKTVEDKAFAAYTASVLNAMPPAQMVRSPRP